jgi:putative heme-binding domain-containing protein
VLERHGPDSWIEKAFAEKDRIAALEALLAVIRIGDKSLQPRVIDALRRFDLATLPPEQQLQVARLWELAFTRMGDPSLDVKQGIAAHLDRYFPAAAPALTRELAGLLVYLDSPTVVAKTVPLLSKVDRSGDVGLIDETLLARNDRYGRGLSAMNATRPDREQFALVFALRSARLGWTPALRETYFGWFAKAYHWTGGLSFNTYLDNIRQIALAAVPNVAQRTHLAEISLRPPPKYLTASQPPKGPGQAYTVDTATELVRGHLTGRNFEQGRAMYIGAACVICHRLGTLSQGTVGPNLTQAGSRYSEHDLLLAIIEPSATINEAAAATRYEMNDGTWVAGYPAFEEKGELFVAANPMAPSDLTILQAANVKATRPYEKSLMPAGLINSLNPDELRDLVAFVLSGGNPRNAMFQAAATTNTATSR